MDDLREIAKFLSARHSGILVDPDPIGDDEGPISIIISKEIERYAIFYPGFGKTVRIIANEYTFDDVPIPVAGSLVDNLLSKRANIKVTGRIVRWAWLSTRIGDEIWEVSRRLKGSLSVWESEINRG
ncbi:hypothetical protein ACFXG8_04440 [Kitasatospora indigofera]|uniref:hypothetical protein n=1 Tax=Kitasatospora indigofera TaxID=67307 RepID=UPI003699A459